MKTAVIQWPGGGARVRIDGRFASAGGVSTSVELWHSERQADGSLARPRLVKTYHAVGAEALSLSPGEVWFEKSGPDGVPWQAHATIEPRERPEKQPTETEQLRAENAALRAEVDSVRARGEALEARLAPIESMFAK